VSAYVPHRYLTDGECKELAVLVHRAARVLPFGRRLVELFTRLLSDAQHARRRAIALDRKLSQLRAAVEPPAPEDPPIPCVRVVA
jgi:hypothetical protein